jgi:hydrogenase maturation protease
VHIVRALAENPVALPEGTELVDGGTLGLELLPLVSEADALILIDAADFGREAGTMQTVAGAALRARLAGHVSPHQAGAGDLIAAARLIGALPSRVAMVGVQPASLEPGLGLSPSVAAALQEAVERVRALAVEMTGAAARA